MGIQMAAENRCRLFTASALHPHGRRQSQRPVSVWPESGGRRSQRGIESGGAAPTRLASGEGLVRDRERVLLVQRSRPSRSENDQNRNLFHARGGGGGERRLLHQYAALAAMARQGRRPAG